MNKLIICLLLCLQGVMYAQTATNDSELKQLKAAVAAAPHDTTRMMAYIQVGNYFYKASQCDTALVYGLKAEAIANQYPNEPKIAVVWNYIGSVYVRLFRTAKGESEKNSYLQNSIVYYKKALSDAKRLGNEEIITKASYKIAFQYAQSDSTYLFFKTSLQLLNHIESKNTYTKTDSSILQSLTIMMCTVMDYNKQSAQFNKYLTIGKRIIPKQSENYEILSLLDFEQHVELWKKADEQRLLDEYHLLKKEIKTHRVNIQLDESLAEYYFNIQAYKKSIEVTENLSYNGDRFKEFDKLGGMGIKFLLLGRNAYMLNQNDLAIRHLKKALHYMDRVYDVLIHEKYSTYLFLSKAYQKSGDYKQAYLFLNQAEVLYKQMHNTQTQDLMAENDVQLEQIKQDRKVQAAQTEVLLKTQEANIQKKQKNIFLAISIIALLSMGLAVMNYLKKKRLSEVLAQQNQTISQQAASLKESNLIKDKIFALLGHDLRAPINRLALRLNQSFDNQGTAIQSELKSMQDILNNVLYWASMQLKGVTPIYTAVPLKPLTDALLEEYQYTLSEKEITCLNAIDKKCTINTDENYLKIILRNLISNAIKFSHPNGYIHLNCAQKNNCAEISLKDTGIGIPPDKIGTLFRLPKPSLGTKRESGTGLGLSLSFDIVKKLNGEIKIHSQEGKGTQVTLILPTAYRAKIAQKETN